MPVVYWKVTLTSVLQRHSEPSRFSQPFAHCFIASSFAERLPATTTIHSTLRFTLSAFLCENILAPGLGWILRRNMRLLLATGRLSYSLEGEKWINSLVRTLDARARHCFTTLWSPRGVWNPSWRCHVAVIFA